MLRSGVSKVSGVDKVSRVSESAGRRRAGRWPAVMSAASCASSGEDPEAWFPHSTDVSEARREAAGAIAVCGICVARECCLELSLRHWDIGQFGVWGGLVPAEREALRRTHRVRHARTATARG
jgi:hypothetical protein